MIVTAAVFAIVLLALVALAPASSRALASSAGSRRVLFGTNDTGRPEPASAPQPPPSLPRPRVSPEDAPSDLDSPPAAAGSPTNRVAD